MSKKPSFARFLFILTVLVLILFVTASTAQAAHRIPGPRQGPKEPCAPVPCVGTAVPPIVPIVSTNVGPVGIGQMPSATPKP